MAEEKLGRVGLLTKGGVEKQMVGRWPENGDTAIVVDYDKDGKPSPSASASYVTDHVRRVTI